MENADRSEPTGAVPAAALLFTRGEVAARLRCCERTLRRLLARTPGVSCIRRNRVMLFAEADVQCLLDVLRAPTSLVVANRSVTVSRSMIRIKPLRHAVTAQEEVRRLTERKKR